MPDDSCEVYQGDQDDYSEYIRSLDLFDVALSSKPFWYLPGTLCPKDSSPTHMLIWFVIHHGLSVSVSEKIMNHIKLAIGNNNISKENFTMKEDTLKKWGLSGDKIDLIKKILSLEELTTKTLCKIKIGLYYLSIFKAMVDEEDDCFVYQDVNIRKNLSVILGRDKIVTESEARKISKNWTGYRSKISYFLYRLRPESMLKVMEEEELAAHDFWGVAAPKIE